MKKNKVVKPINHKRSYELKLTDRNAIIILLLLPVIYFLIFGPSLLTGSKMMYGSDWLLGGYATRKIESQEIAQFKTIPKWYPYIFGGIPIYGVSLYSFIQTIIPTHIFWTYLFVFGFIIAGIGMYLFLRSIEISIPVALIASVAYEFTGNLVSTTYAGHEGRMLSVAFFPLALFLWHKALSTHKFYWFVFAGALGGFSMTHAHFQLTYYGLWVAIAYFIVQLIWQWQQNKIRKTLKLVGYAILTIVVALGILAVNYIPLLANIATGARGETRGYEFSASWSLPPKELFDLIVPQFSGILDNYWGENFFKLHTEYFGIVLLIAAILGLVIKVRERKTLFFLITSIIVTLIALGGHTPFFKLIYYLLPGIKKFRGPSMAFYLAAFSIIVLGAFGIQHFLDYSQQKKNLDPNIKKRLKKWTYIIIVIFIILIITFLVIKSNTASFIKDPAKIKAFMNNISHFWSGILISVIIVFVSIMLFYRLATQKLTITNFIILIIPIICFDLWRVNSMFLKTVDHPNVYYAPDEVVNFLRKDTTRYRVHPLYDGMFGLRVKYEHSNDGLLDLYHIQNVGGYSPNPLQTYQDFIGAEKTVMFYAPNLTYPNFLNLLNVKYIISPQLPSDVSKYDAMTQTAIRELQKYLSQNGIEPVFNGKKYVIYKNNNMLPRAFLVPNYEVINDKNQIIERLKDNNFNPSKYVLLSESLYESISHNDTVSGSVKITNYTPNMITLETEQDNSGFLVLSENFHPEWICKVDGKPTKIYQAYHTLRAVYLEKGKHKIEFFYCSIYFQIGLIITAITSLFCVAILIIMIVRKRKKDKIQTS